MVDATTELTGRQALHIAFQEISYAEEFDGIWACASLLHLPLVDLPDAFCRFTQVLRLSGVIYASFNEGKGERNQNGRLFTDMDEPSMRELLTGFSGLEMIQLWHTVDLRPDRSDKWLNVLLQRRAS